MIQIGLSLYAKGHCKPVLTLAEHTGRIPHLDSLAATALSTSQLQSSNFCALTSPSTLTSRAGHTLERGQRASVCGNGSGTNPLAWYWYGGGIWPRPSLPHLRVQDCGFCSYRLWLRTQVEENLHYLPHLEALEWEKGGLSSLMRQVLHKYYQLLWHPHPTLESWNVGCPQTCYDDNELVIISLFPVPAN